MDCIITNRHKNRNMMGAFQIVAFEIPRFVYNDVGANCLIQRFLSSHFFLSNRQSFRMERSGMRNLHNDSLKCTQHFSRWNPIIYRISDVRIEVLIIVYSASSISQICSVRKIRMYNKKNTAISYFSFSVNKCHIYKILQTAQFHGFSNFYL